MTSAYLFLWKIFLFFLHKSLFISKHRTIFALYLNKYLFNLKF